MALLSGGVHHAAAWADARTQGPPGLSQARESLRAGDTKTAVELLAETVQLDPESAEAHALLGRALMLDRRFRSALTPLERAVELGARDAHTLLLLGSALWENGELAAAEEVLRGGVESAGGDVALVRTLGQLLLWQGRYPEAASWLAEAMAKEASVGGLLDLARALDGAGREEEALVAYRRVAELAPEESRARYGLARLLQRMGDEEAARQQMEIYRRLYERDQERVRAEGHQEATIARGDELVQAGQVQMAVALLRDLPQTPDSLAALGRAYRAAGDLETAIETVERAVGLAPQRSDLRSLLHELRLAGSRP